MNAFDDDGIASAVSIAVVLVGVPGGVDGESRNREDDVGVRVRVGVDNIAEPVVSWPLDEKIKV
jgi:hypothetical protein